MQLKIMKYTDKYANDYSKTQKKYDWKDLDQTELKAFFSLLIIISPYSVRMRENTDQKKIRIWTLFTQCSKSSCR